MAKTLVIKGADFSVNALDHVVLVSKPCTGIAFDRQTAAIADMQPLTLAVTVTPSDTTDRITYTTTDPNVATVANGVITPIGLGTASVTAHCGSYSATCVVEVSYNLIGVYKPCYFNPSSDNTYLTTSGMAYSRLALVAPVREYTIPPSDINVGSASGVLLPKGTKKLRISVTNSNMFANSNYNYGYFLAEQYAGSSTFPKAAKLVGFTSGFNARTGLPKTIDVPEGTDSFVFAVQLATAVETGTDMNTIAEQAGLKVECLAE